MRNAEPPLEQVNEAASDGLGYDAPPPALAPAPLGLGGRRRRKKCLNELVMVKFRYSKCNETWIALMCECCPCCGARSVSARATPTPWLRRAKLCGSAGSIGWSNHGKTHEIDYCVCFFVSSTPHRLGTPNVGVGGGGAGMGGAGGFFVCTKTQQARTRARTARAHARTPPQ